MKVFIDKYQENKVAYCGGYRRAKKHLPSYTDYWTRGMTSIHPEENRFLSPREWARIPSFPNRFIFKGTTIENYTQICNAVPPLLAKAFGWYIIKILIVSEINPIPWQIYSNDNYQNFREKIQNESQENNLPIQLKLPI